MKKGPGNFSDKAISSAFRSGCTHKRPEQIFVRIRPGVFEQPAVAFERGYHYRLIRWAESYFRARNSGVQKFTLVDEEFPKTGSTTSPADGPQYYLTERTILLN